MKAKPEWMEGKVGSIYTIILVLVYHPFLGKTKAIELATGREERASPRKCPLIQKVGDKIFLIIK